tara:strand:+ start:329 stop:559 length:231 start_codon:yes stop_codon:yes gene_type:complete
MIKDKKTIIQKLATKHNLSLDNVEKIIDHQFKFVSNIMKSGNFETIRLPYFGKFSVNPNRVKYINKLKKDSEKETV